FGEQDLDGDSAAVLPLFGEVDPGHPAATELALDCIPGAQGWSRSYSVVEHASSSHLAMRFGAPPVSLLESSRGLRLDLRSARQEVDRHARHQSHADRKCGLVCKEERRVIGRDTSRVAILRGDAESEEEARDLFQVA